MKRFSKRARRAFVASMISIAASINGGCKSLQYISQVSHADQFGNVFATDIVALKDQAEQNIGSYNKPARNEYIAMKMFEIDREFFDFISLLNASDTGIASFADFAQLGLTTAATAIPVVQTTKVLATAATAVGGARAVYNQDLLRTQTLQAIQTQMDADRLKIRNTIVSRMDVCQAAQYPMGFVLADLQAYAAAGTPDSAIVALTNSATKAKQAASAPNSTANADGDGGGSGGGSGGGKKSQMPLPPGLGTLSVTYTPVNICPLPNGQKSATGVAALY